MKHFDETTSLKKICDDDLRQNFPIRRFAFKTTKRE
jgi:hypothetical protein